jgi:hypothetical protein
MMFHERSLNSRNELYVEQLCLTYQRRRYNFHRLRSYNKNFSIQKVKEYLMRIVRTGLVVISLFLAACASQYQDQGFSGGFSDNQISNDTFDVVFNGNGYTSRQRASDLNLLRSAELTLESGFSHFIILDRSASVDRSTSVTTSNTMVTGGYGSMNATSFGTTIPISKPSSQNRIRCFKEKPEGVFSYDAQIVYKNLSEIYGVEKKQLRFGGYFSKEIPVHIERRSGVHVQRVVHGRPMQKAGIARGDIIVAVNGEVVSTSKQLGKIIGNYPDEKKEIRFTVLRDNIENDFLASLD